MLEEALDYYDQSIKINEKVYGSESVKVARNLAYIGDIMKEMKDVFSASTYYHNALRIILKIHGSDSVKTKLVKNRIDSLKII